MSWMAAASVGPQLRESYLFVRPLLEKELVLCVEQKQRKCTMGNFVFVKKLSEMSINFTHRANNVVLLVHLCYSIIIHLLNLRNIEVLQGLLPYDLNTEFSYWRVICKLYQSLNNLTLILLLELAHQLFFHSLEVFFSD